VGFRFAMMVVEAAGGRRRRSKRKRESTRSDQTGSIVQRGSTALSICLSDPQERDEAVAQEAAQTSVKKGAYLGPSIDGDRGASVKAAWFR
jgi:hypothetical protein